jgi:hypothetical protein
MYHTIGTWPKATPQELADIVEAKADTYVAPNGTYVSVKELDDGINLEIIRQWETLEDANAWVAYMQGHNVTCQVVSVPE